MSQLSKYCDQLSSFSNDPKIDKISEIIAALSTLCKNKSVVQIQFLRFTKCCICERNKGQLAQLKCSHVLHPDCLELKAKNLSKSTFDPSLLLQLVCQKCKTLISQDEYTRILGRQKVERYQEKQNLRLQEQLIRQDKEERAKFLASRTFTCELCLQTPLISEAITMSCTSNHRFCKDCTTEMIRAQIKEGKYESNSIVCKAEGCGEVLDEQLIRFCIGAEEYNKYSEIQHKNLKVEGLEMRQCWGYTYKDKTRLVEFNDKMDQKQYVKAQQELQRKCKAIDLGQIAGANLKGEILKCQAIISYDPKENDQGGFLKCWDCLLESCIKGCKSAHRGNTCQKYKQWQAINNKSQQVSLEQILKLGMAQCQSPTCMRIILKNQGCDHVTCVCGFQICYRCSKPYSVCRTACPPRKV